MSEVTTESFWLRTAKIAALNRDPVDAVNDAEALLRFTENRLTALCPAKPSLKT